MTVFHKFEESKIVEAIQQAELETSGEIRIHIQNKRNSDNLEEVALKTFYDLGMDKTQERNGVLLYVDFYNHRFTVLGDEGIHAKVGQDFWDDLIQLISSCFKRNEVVQGIVAGIYQIGRSLKDHFPYQTNDVNELSNEISYN